MSDHLHISYSQMNTYLLCPERFRLQYVRGVRPSHVLSSLVFGSAIHGALERYHEQLLTERSKPALATIVDSFRSRMEMSDRSAVPVLWEDNESKASLLGMGERLLSLYLDEVRIHRVLSVEQPFSMPIGELGLIREESLVGVVDLIEEDFDGSVFITELKTAARRYDGNKLAYDHQMSLYAAAAGVLGYPDAKLRYRVLLKTKEPALATYPIKRARAQIAEAHRVMGQVLRAIDHGIYYPVRGWACASCAFRYACGE